MSDRKTHAHDGDVDAFLASVTHKTRHADALVLLDMMKEVTGHDPKMWGPSIIGFDSYHYKYESGREGDACISGFSPRKANLVVYITPGFKQYDDLLARLGKYKSSVSCLYINKLADVDLDVLRELVSQSYIYMRQKYHGSG